jgi:hypothetical protein
MTRRAFEQGLVSSGAALVAACHDYHPACPSDRGSDGSLEGYEPRYLSRAECVTLAAVAEVMIAECPPVISAAEVAKRADQMLTRMDAPAAKQARLAIDVLENLGSAAALRAGAFSDLDLAARKTVLDRLVRHGGLSRDITRVLKVLTVVPYYSHPEVRRAIGFVDFDERERIPKGPNRHPLPTFVERKAHPEPEEFG